jgi:hypothetical protein
VRGDQPHLPDRHGQGVSGHVIGLRGGLEPPNLVCGQDLLEQLGEAGVGQLRLGDLAGAVGQRGQPQPPIAQATQCCRHLRVGWQLADALEDRLLVGLVQGDAAQGGGGLQGGLGDGAELVVAAGGDGDQGGLDELLEPGLAGGWIAEGTPKVGVEGAQVQQGLVDIEDIGRWYGSSLGSVTTGGAGDGSYRPAGGGWSTPGPRRGLEAARRSASTLIAASEAATVCSQRRPTSRLQRSPRRHRSAAISPW